MTQPVHGDATALWRRWLARSWYYWGLSLGHWGLRLGERALFDAARSSFDRAASLWPIFAAPYYQRGVLLTRELGMHAAGLEDFSRAIMLAPDWPEPYLQRGLTARFHGDPRAATADLRRFIALAPASPWRSEADRQLAQILAGEE